MGPVARLLRWFFLIPWRAIDAEVEAERAAVAGGRPAAAPQSDGKRGKRARAAPGAAPARPTQFDFRPLVVLVTVCVSLTLQEYVGERGFFVRHFPELAGGQHGELIRHAWWAGWRFLGYVVIPIAVILAMPGERVRDYYLSWSGFRSKLRIYLLLFLLILPVVIGASRFPEFQQIYPFYKWANRSAADFWVWEALYALQFLSLEFFFRGFMLKALAPRFGSGAIFVMVVPYCLIHFGKAMPETLGAIVAGLVLGTLAMRTRSIWGGVLLHVSVAVTMDLLAVGYCPPAESGLPCPSR